MQTVLIDTDVAIDFLRGNESTKSWIAPLWQQSAAFISILTVYELLSGVKPKEQKATEHFISACRVEPVTVAVATLAASEYQQYRQEGITLTSIDCLIAATAKINKHQLATRNIKHYPDKKILYKPAT